MLKEMVSTADSSQIIEQNKNLTKMYEECKKMTSTTTTTTIANGNSNMPRLRTSLSPPKHSIQLQQQHQRCGDIFNLIDAFKSKIENEFSYLKGQAKTLEDRLKSSQSNVTSPTSFLKEIEQFRQVVQSTQATFDREKYFLFKDLNSQKHLNPIIVANIQNDLERNLNEKYLEFSNLIKKFYSSVPPATCSNSATCTTRVVTTVNRSSSFNHNRTVDSSFLTEEEEAIKKISEKIKFIKAKISSKAPKVSKRVKTAKNSHLNESSSDDTDTKELAHLNEQIRQIKSKMILKGDQLSKMKKNSNDEFIEKSRQKTCTGPIYLPINHLSRRSKNGNTSGGGEIFKIMPANFCSQSYNDEEEEEEDFQMEKSRNNFFRNGAATATTVSSTNVASKFYLVRKSGEENKKEFSVSPERKYMSSVEIPAEQLEALKGNYIKN
jgi:hypothetical protein